MLRRWPTFVSSGFRLCIVEPANQPRVAVVDPINKEGIRADIQQRLLDQGFRAFGQHGRFGIVAKQLSVSRFIAEFDGVMDLVDDDQVILGATRSPAVGSSTATSVQPSSGQVDTGESDRSRLLPISVPDAPVGRIAQWRREESEAAERGDSAAVSHLRRQCDQELETFLLDLIDRRGVAVFSAGTYLNRGRNAGRYFVEVYPGAGSSSATYDVVVHDVTNPEGTVQTAFSITSPAEFTSRVESIDLGLVSPGYALDVSKEIAARNQDIAPRSSSIFAHLESRVSSAAPAFQVLDLGVDTKILAEGSGHDLLRGVYRDAFLDVLRRSGFVVTQELGGGDQGLPEYRVFFEEEPGDRFISSYVFGYNKAPIPQEVVSLYEIGETSVERFSRSEFIHPTANRALVDHLLREGVAAGWLTAEEGSTPFNFLTKVINSTRGANVSAVPVTNVPVLESAPLLSIRERYAAFSEDERLVQGPDLRESYGGLLGLQVEEIVNDSGVAVLVASGKQPTFYTLHPSLIDGTELCVTFFDGTGARSRFRLGGASELPAYVDVFKLDIVPPDDAWRIVRDLEAGYDEFIDSRPEPLAFFKDEIAARKDTPLHYITDVEGLFNASQPKEGLESQDAADTQDEQGATLPDAHPDNGGDLSQNAEPETAQPSGDVELQGDEPDEPPTSTTTNTPGATPDEQTTDDDLTTRPGERGGSLPATDGAADGAVGSDSPEGDAVAEPGETGRTAAGEPSDTLSGRPAGADESDGGDGAASGGDSESAAEDGQYDRPDDVPSDDLDSGRGKGALPAAGRDGEPGRGLNWRPSDENLVEVLSRSERKEANIQAVHLLKRASDEKRSLDDAEKLALLQYSGWGGLGYMLSPTGPYAGEMTSLVEDGVVSNDAFESWVRSDSDAYYTPYYLASGIWQTLVEKGFEGGRVIEPSAGVGRFLATTPTSIAPNTRFTAIEKEQTAGRILSSLYGEHADVRIAGYEEVFLRDNTFDLAIGNIPFGSHRIQDRKEFGSKSELIHDYFILKTLKKVKPGGVVAFITSTGTMDKANSAVRDRIGAEADLLGAIRLPKRVMAETAGTDVSMDILVFRRAIPGQDPGGFPFTKVVDVPAIAVKPMSFLSADGNVISVARNETINLPVNEAFAAHPEWGGGKFLAVMGPYGPELATDLDTDASLLAGYDPENDELSLEDKVRLFLKTLQNTLPDDLFSLIGNAPETQEQSLDTSPVQTRRQNKDVVVQGFFINEEDDRVHVVTHLAPDVDKDTGENFWRVYSTPLDLTPANQARVKALVQLRDQVKTHLYLEADSPLDAANVEESRSALNASYDAFVKRFGFVNSRECRKWVLEDAAGGALLGLEIWDEEKKTAEKARIFSTRVIAPPRAKENAETLREAAVLSVSQVGKISLTHVCDLLGLPPDEVLDHIHATNDLYKNPATNNWELREQYLSGNVREKLEAAKSASVYEPEFKRNVEALTSKLPEWLPVEDIHVSLSSTWLPGGIREQFLSSLLNGSNPNQFKAEFVPILGQWSVTFDSTLKTRFMVAMTEEYGTEDYPLNKVFEAALANKSPVITRDDGEGGRYKDVEASLQAQIKVDQIKEAFKTWLDEQPQIKDLIENVYNHRFNSFNYEDYDGSDFEFPGLSPLWEPQAHQRNAVFRALIDGNTLIAHCVGAGKTMEQAMILMESKRLGLLNKPAIAVPNHLLLQTAGAIKSYYPMANILVVDKSDLASPDARRAFVAKVAMNDWDGVVVTHSMLPKLKAPLETEIALAQELVDDYESMLDATARLDKAAGGRSFNERSLRKKISEEKARLKELIESRQQRSDDDFDLKQLGIDGLLVDESHYFKNLEIRTTLNIPGLTNTDSQRAMDMFVKSRYLMDRHGGERGLYMFTGTPIANSISELYTNHRYLRPSIYQSAGINDFVTWVTTFGEVTRNLEILPEGSGFQLKSRLTDFHNLPELLTMFRLMADVKNKEDLNLPTPQVETVTVVAEQNHWIEAYMRELTSRAGKVRNRMVEPSEDNLLKISGDGRKASLCMGLIDDRIPMEDIDKVALLVNNLVDIHGRFTEQKATQLVFCDLGTPSDKVSYDRTAMIQGMVSSGLSEADAESISRTFYRSLQAKKPRGMTTMKLFKNAMSDYEFDEHQLENPVEVAVGAVESAKRRGFSVYDLIKTKLVEAGVPEEEVAFMQDASTDTQKASLQQKVRDGQVRILIGSTESMGTGTNVQDRLIALHNLDCPWRPCDIEQRIGRIDRRGNMFEEVMVMNYTTKDSLDLFLWETVRRKAKFIAQGMSDPRSISRSLSEDTDLNYAQIVALTTGNPLIGRKVEIDAEVQKLERLEAMHNQRSRRLDTIVSSQESERKYVAGRYEDFRKAGEVMLNCVKETGRSFVLELQGPIGKEQAGTTTWLSSAGAKQAFEVALATAQLSASFKKDGSDVVLGAFNGLDLSLHRFGGSTFLQISNDGKMLHEIRVPTDMPFSVRRLSNFRDELPEEVKQFKAKLDDLEASIDAARNGLESGGEFQYKHQLDKLKEEQRTINESLEREAAERGDVKEYCFAAYVEACLEDMDDEVGELSERLSQTENTIRRLEQAALF